MPDEWYYKGHNLATANCPACREAFKKAYGYDSMPKQVEDTEQCRKWKLFEYRQHAALFQSISAELASTSRTPNSSRATAKAASRSIRRRMEHTIPADIMANDPNANLVQAYGSTPRFRSRGNGSRSRSG